MSSNLIVNNIEVGAGATIYTAASNTLTFGTNGSEKVRISSGGEVGIGINNPEGYEANGNNFSSLDSKMGTPSHLLRPKPG